MIDWAATGQMLSGIGAITGAVAIVVAAILGKNALADYRKQRLVDREIEAAEQALTVAYRAFEAISNMRGRWIPGHETEATEAALRDAGLELEGMEAAEKSAYVIRGVIYRRAEFFRKDFDAVFECIPLAKVYFGKNVADWLSEFPRARNRMLSSADFLPMTSGIATFEQDKDFAVTVRRDVFGVGDNEPDEIRDMVKSALDQLEVTLFAKLRAEKESHA